MICIPVTANNMKEAKDRLARALPLADLVELRIDFIYKPSLERLLKNRAGKFIVTNRRQEEGGAFQGSERERIKCLMEAVALGAGYVDIEATTDEALLGELFARVEKFGCRTKIIVSHHDLSRTPPVHKLRKIWAHCCSMGGDLVKIITTARRVEDNLALLGLIPYSLRRQRPIIAFCMGEAGRISRIMAPAIGASICFAALEEGHESAPGQWTIGEMNKIFSIMEEAGMSVVPGRAF
ncbi:MAG: type I 3-dehydroquinate dehydratase [Syntrophales bacterium]|jgi:3-dehydroquinate dehydratase type I